MNLSDRTKKLEKAMGENAVHVERAQAALYSLEDHADTLKANLGLLLMLARVEKALGPDFEVTFVEGTDVLTCSDVEGDFVHKPTGCACGYNTYDSEIITLFFPGDSSEDEPTIEFDKEIEFDVSTETGDLSVLVERVNAYVGGRDMSGVEE